MHTWDEYMSREYTKEGKWKGKGTRNIDLTAIPPPPPPPSPLSEDLGKQSAAECENVVDRREISTALLSTLVQVNI
jgi:hypothetical protein